MRSRGSLLGSVIGSLVVAAGAFACSADPAWPAIPPAEAEAGSAGDGAATADDAGVEGGPAGPATAATLCAATYGAIHDSYDACCTASDRSTLRHKLVFGQLAVFKGSCTPQLEASVSSGRVALDAAAHASCVSAYAKFFAGGACGKDLSPVLEPQKVPGCDAAVLGKQALGRPCLRDYECEAGLTCVGFSGQRDGQCKKAPAAGEECGAGKTDPNADAGSGEIAVIDFDFGDHPRCAAGAYCNRTTRKCAASVAAGGACSDSEQCAPGLSCLLGTCDAGKPSGAGGPCKSNRDCNATSLFCDASGGGGGGAASCAPKKPEGAACTGAGGAGGSTCKGQCVSADGGTTGACASFCGSG